MAIVRTLDAVTRPGFAPGDRVREVSRVVLAPGGQPTTPRPMLWQTGVELIDREHAQAGTAPDVDYFIVPDAILAGAGAMPQLDGAYLYAPTLFPEYVRYFIGLDMQGEFWSPPAEVSVRDVPIAISIINYNLVFGHWLLEMFPKLLLLKSSLAHLRAVPIVLPSTAPAYVTRIIREVLGDWPILTYDRLTEALRVETLILPGAMHTGYFYHPHANALFDQHAIWARRSLGHRLGAARDGLYRLAGAPGAGERLFVSRSQVVSGFRKLTNAAELEAIAKGFGFRVIAPEQMSWRDQVAVFSRARFITGEFGSGMHNTLFSPHGAKVVCLNWLVETQSRIANLRGQDVGYVLTDDGQPQLFTLEGTFREYAIDPQRFREGLERMLSSDRP